MHVPDADAVTDADRVSAYIADRGLDYLKVVPSHLAALAGSGGVGRLLPGRALILGGEAAPLGLVDDLLAAAGDRAVVNHYGPTETTIGVVTGRLSDSAVAHGAVPLGGRSATPGCSCWMTRCGR